MIEDLDRYLAQVYRRDVKRESVKIEMPKATAELIAGIKAQVAHIDGLGLGANLVNRDFVAYQNRRALVALLKHLEAQNAARKVK